MYFKQFYLGCLAHASYMIASEGEAAVVDPQRDVDLYLEEARSNGLTIRHVIETHLHADFVSGHLELAEKTGAKIYFGHAAGAKFEHVPVREGDEIEVGKVRLRILETPGHTPESISIVVHNGGGSGEPEAVLTGDTLFIGDVGRPDLAGAAMSAQELAGKLFDSLHQKLLKLPDSVKVYPAHGAGSLCGRNISSERSSTIGQEKLYNYALKIASKEEFVRMMTTDLPEAPEYFSMDAEINRAGAAALEDLPRPKEMSPREVEELQKNGAVILDTRPSSQYGTAHIPGSLNIGLGGQFASWAGTLIPLHASIVIVAENEDRVDEARKRLARVGLEKVAGYLSGGIHAWETEGLPLAATDQISVDELKARIEEGSHGRLLDVRRAMEWEGGHIREAMHAPLHQLTKGVRGLDKVQPVTAICAGGYRSSIATSILEQIGFKKITNVVGGMAAWQNAKHDVVTESRS